MNIFDIAVILTATDRATRTIQKVHSALDGARNAARAQAMVQWGQQVSAQGALIQGAADRINGSLTSIMQPALELEDALAFVDSLPGITEASVGRMKSAALDWSQAHKDSAKSFVDTTYNMISAGLAEEAALEGTRVAMQVATATRGEATQSAALLATIYNNMGDKSAELTAEMTRLGDVVTRTQQTFQLESLSQLNEGLKYGVPTALQYGMSLEELSTVIGLMNSKGIVGSQAGTSFAATMRVMTKASKDLGFEVARTATGSVDFLGTVRNLEAKFGTLSQMSPDVQDALQQAFGAEGWTGLSLLIGKSAELEQGLGQVMSSAGTTADAVQQIEGTKGAGLAKIVNHLTAMKIALADQLGPTIDTYAPKVLALIQTFGAWVKENPGLVRTVLVIMAITGALFAILGPLLLVVGGLTVFAGHTWAAVTFIAGAFKWMALKAVPFLWSMTVAAAKFAAVLLANPITWVVLAVVAAVALIYIYWEPIKDFFADLWASIASGFAAAWTAIVGGVTTAWAQFSALFEDGFLLGLGRLLLGIPTMFFEIFTQLPGILGTVVGLLWEAIWNWTPLGWFMQAFDAVTQYLFGFSLFDAGANIVSSLWSGMQSLASKPVELMRKIVGGVRNLLPFSPAKEGPLRDIHRIKLVETIAGAIKPAPMVRAMRGAVAAAAAAVPAAAAVGAMTVGGGAAGGLAQPSIAPSPPVVSAPGAARGPEGDVHFTLSIAGNADTSTVQELERLLRDNARLIYQMMKREKKLDERGEF